jgi:hypothetical protein
MLRMVMLAVFACLGFTAAPFTAKAADTYRVMANGHMGDLVLDINNGVVTGVLFGDPIRGFSRDGRITFVRGAQTYQGWFQQNSNDVFEWDGYFIDIASGTLNNHVFAWSASRIRQPK